MTISLLQQLESIKSSENLLKEIKSLDQEAMEAIYERINESLYSQREWAEALAEITAFTEKKQRLIPLEHRLEYISCCVESQALNGPITDLKSIVDYFLNNYGIE